MKKLNSKAIKILMQDLPGDLAALALGFLSGYLIKYFNL